LTFPAVQWAFEFLPGSPVGFSISNSGKVGFSIPSWDFHLREAGILKKKAQPGWAF